MKPSPPPPSGRPPTGRKGLRWLRRLAILLLVLGGVGLAAFTWFAYWPFEGRVDRVESLVPADVDFLYRTSWREIRASGWIQRNLWDDPVLPSLDPRKVTVDDRGTTLAGTLDQIPETEAQINDSVPAPLKVLEGVVFGSREFRVERDLFPGEVVAAGRWCSGGSPAEGPPRWREILLLTRVTPVVKFAFEAVRHDFVRERALARDDLEVEATPDGLLRVELTRMAVPRRRPACEGGAEMGPLNVWWVARVKDVLAVTNSEDLARKTLDVSRGSFDRALDRPGFDVERPEGGVAAALDLVGLRSYLNRFFSSADDTQHVGAFLGKFLAVDSLDRMSAALTLSPDGVLARADIAYSEDRLREFRDVAATYDLAPGPVAEGIARLLPAKDTAIVAQLRTPPRALLGALWESFPRDVQKVIRDHVREIAARRRREQRPGYQDVGEFLDELAAQLGSSTAVAVAHVSSVFGEPGAEKVKYETWYSNADPVPTATLAVMLRIREGAKQEDVDEFLSDRARALGFQAPEQVTSPEGITYSRLRMEGKPRDYALVEPAFKVHEGYLILSTREDYLLEILKVMRGGPGAPASVSASPEFRAVMGSLPGEATLALFANGGNLRRLLWDYRNQWVHFNHDDSQYAIAFRARRHAEISRAGGRVDLAKVNEEVDREVDRYRREEYPKFIDEYRARLDASARIAGGGIVLAARKADAKIETGLRVLFTPGRSAGE